MSTLDVSDNKSSITTSDRTKPDLKNQYIAYPKTLQRLRERFEATPHELAAWIFLGPKYGGIAAYRNANELAHPLRFYFDYSMGEDYISPMMRCWFLTGDVESFEPESRFILGSTLIERWSKLDVIDPKSFILAKIEEFRLIEIHPTFVSAK